MTSNFTENTMPAMTLEQFNQQELSGVIALVVYLSTISVTGTIGNILVIYIYLTQFERSNSKYFTLCLAFTDLFSSVISHPFEIPIVMNKYTFTSDPICKMARFFNWVPSLASGCIFVSIATDRFRKVCRPFDWQLSSRAAKYLCVGSFFYSAIFAWPSLCFSGLKLIPVPEHQGNGTTCSISNSYNDTVYPSIFFSINAFFFILGVFFLVTMFTLIGLQLRSQSEMIAKSSHTIEVRSENSIQPDPSTDQSSSHGRGNTRGFASEDISKLNSSNEIDKTQDNLTEPGCTGDIILDEYSDHGNEADTIDDVVILDRKNGKQKGDGSGNINDHTRTGPETNAQTLPNESRNDTALMQSFGDQDKGRFSSAKKQGFFQNVFISSKRSRKGFQEAQNNRQYNSNQGSRIDRKRNRRITFVMFFITLAFILSYLPPLVLLIIREIKKDLVSSMSTGQRAVYWFFLRSYALNSAVNPFIYSACDKRFRVACRKTFRRLRSNWTSH